MLAWNATSDKASMMAALLSPGALLEVADGQITATVTFVPGVIMGIPVDGSAITEVWAEISSAPTAGTGLTGTYDSEANTSSFTFPLSTLDMPMLYMNVSTMGSIMSIRLNFDLDLLAPYEAPVVVDKTALVQALFDAETIAQGNYTDESFQALQAAIAAAQAVAADSDATQTQVDAQISALNAAVDALEENQLPSGKAAVAVSGPETIMEGEEAEYLFSVGNIDGMNTAVISFEIDSAYFEFIELSPLNGLAILGDVKWSHEGDISVGRVVLGGYNENAFSAADLRDVLSLKVKAADGALGLTGVKIEAVSLSGFGEGDGVFFDFELTSPLAQTEILKVYSPYDVNRDGIINQLDLSVALYYYQAAEGDDNWDVSGRADVNADGVVDIADYIALIDYLGL